MKAIPVRRIRPSEEPAAGRFSIRRVEDLLKDGDLQHPLHRHDFFFILVIHSGVGKHEIDFVKYPVKKNSVFMLRPGQVHQLHLEAGSAGYLIEFDPGFYNPANTSSASRFSIAGGKNYCVFDTKQFERINNIFSGMLEEFENKQGGYAEALKALLQLFFIAYTRQSENTAGRDTKNSYALERFDQFTTLLEQHAVVQKKVVFYTGSMGLSAYQLNEITKTAVGKTASVLIDEHILLEAKRSLLATTAQVKEIAAQLGFEDPSYFVRFFRKNTGISPDAFRKNFR